MIVRSNLFDLTVRRDELGIDKHRRILAHQTRNPAAFLTISQSVFETTIIAGNELRPALLKLFDKRAIIAEFDDLSSITIKLTKETTRVPGVYYLILKALAWEGINLIEVVSTFTELTIIIENKHIDRASTVIKDLFS